MHTPSSAVNIRELRGRTKMAIVDTDWNTFLSPDSELPPDVCFLVTGEDERSSKTIRAHSQLLGGVSPVFRKQFFGPMKDEREVIEVEMTSAEAFQKLIDFIYKPAGEDTFTMDKISRPQKHFEVLELAERYEILDLKTPVKKALEAFVVTKGNFQLSATVAMNNKEEFEDCSVILSLRCLKFLQDTAKNPYDMIEDTKNRFPGVSQDILLELKRVKDEKMPGNINHYLH